MTISIQSYNEAGQEQFLSNPKALSQIRGSAPEGKEMLLPQMAGGQGSLQLYCQ